MLRCIWQTKLVSAVGVVLFVGAFAAGASEKPAKVDFNFHIRPILSDRCFKCHGPDEKSRKADLRLDTAEGAAAVLDEARGIRAITPKKINRSEVYRRIVTKDADELMPPPDSNLKLDPAEIELIRKWIEQGAEYKSHWSFIPLGKTAIPKVKSKWAKTPIDSFVLKELQNKKLKPAPEATRETLIRRLSLDLTGLPPTVEEIDAFLHDTSSKAYENVVDRLLASSAYGERMANDWLDLARYADTYGYQSDADRDMSPWRDWVINSFNENLPYDRFVTWQIAGDLLPDATDEQILATAFNRLHRQTNEGGSIEEEFRTEYVADRVHTFGTAFLGLTLECARCHDHKYDPIKQREYYELFAFFNNADESGLYSHFTQATPSPTLLLYQRDQRDQHARLKQSIAAKQSDLLEIAKSARQTFKEWEQPTNLVPTASTAFPFDLVEKDTSPDIAGKNSAKLVEGPTSVQGVRGRGLQFSGDNSVVCKGAGDFKRTDSFSFALWVKPSEQQDRAVIFHRSRAWTDSGSRGYELVLHNGAPTFSLVHFWPGNAIAVRGSKPLPTNQWSHIAVTYDGSSRARGLEIYVNGEAANSQVLRDNLFKDILHRAEWGDADVGHIDLTIGARFRDSGFKNGSIDEFQVFDRRLTALEIQQLAGVAANQLSKELLFDLYLNRHVPEFQKALVELKTLREQENQLVNGIREIMVMNELPERRPTFVLKRGAYNSPAEPVVSETPESLLPFPKELPRNRLGLAKWLTDPRNPLTARVAVNRVWKMHFGRGLVDTPEDFGSQGQLPTHPELLDWLARNFIESGWDMKALHKLIVTSATYRQSSVAKPELLADDPDNRWLARGPKQRLSAEQIRDSALRASGLLSQQIGGPSVKPYQPSGLWEQSGLAKSYAQDSGPNLYRRSVYTFWRRTSPPPSMTTFDAPSREVCTAKREVTATPLQALVLLNDPQFVEASRVLAEQLIGSNEGVGARIDGAFRRILGRKPHSDEQKILQLLFQEQLEEFAKDTAAVEKLLAIGQQPLSAKSSKSELAAMTVLVSTLMNHDEFVMKR